jgi:hypothetical protein
MPVKTAKNNGKIKASAPSGVKAKAPTKGKAGKQAINATKFGFKSAKKSEPVAKPTKKSMPVVKSKTVMVAKPMGKPGKAKSVKSKK